MKRFEQSIVLDEMYNSKINKKSAIFDPLSLLKIDRKIVTYTTAITLPLILAACGGGGGGGAVSPTPDSGSSSSSSSDSSSSASTTAGTEANAGNYTASSEADTYLYDVTFSSNGSSVLSSLDGNVTIADFDPASDVIVLRGAGSLGASGSPADFAAGGASNVDVASDINGNTVISLGNDNDNTGTITLTGVSDSSSVVIKTVDEAADAGRPVIDLSSGSVTATDAGEVFEYSVRFENGVPVAIDGDVTINGFDAATDRIVLKTEGLPSGYLKGTLLTTDGVDVAPGISNLLIAFGPNASGSSGSITIEGVTKLADVDLVFSVSSPSIKGDRVDIDSGASLAASSSSETFVYDASWDGDEVVGSDGDVTITGFSLADDKIIVLGANIPSGYESKEFTGNSKGTQQIVVDEINNKTTIYFAPGSDGSSSTITLDGVADTQGNLNIVFGSSIGDEPAPEPAAADTSTDTSSTDSTDTSSTDSTDTSSTDSTDTSSTDSTDTSSTDSTDSTDTSSTDSTASSSYTVVNVDASSESTITASSDAEDFRYEIDSAGVSQEGAFTVTIDGFDIATDKLTLVIVGGTDNLTTQEFDGLSGVEVTSDGLSGTQIFFAPDSSGQSGGLTLSGVEESFDDTWTATTYTVEIIADTNLTG
jgi:hypothetical protein